MQFLHVGSGQLALIQSLTNAYVALHQIRGRPAIPTERFAQVFVESEP
jgi:hypothetical protein